MEQSCVVGFRRNRRDNNEDVVLVLNVGEMILIIAGILIGYGLVLAFYYVVSHKYYGEKHVKACRDVKEYLRTLKNIEKIDRDQEKAQRTVRTTITA